MEKEKLVEVVRSFSFKLSLPNYQNADFFCSKKLECKESEAEKVSAELHSFCQEEVEFSVNAYKEDNKKEAVKEEPKVAKSAFSKTSKGWIAKSDSDAEDAEEIKYDDDIAKSQEKINNHTRDGN